MELIKKVSEKSDSIVQRRSFPWTPMNTVYICMRVRTEEEDGIEVKDVYAEMGIVVRWGGDSDDGLAELFE